VTVSRSRRPIGGRAVEAITIVGSRADLQSGRLRAGPTSAVSLALLRPAPPEHRTVAAPLHVLFP